jgi:hypothetical protein
MDIGQTTLAGMIAQEHPVTVLDLESPQGLARLQNPESVLSDTRSLVIIDEIQRKPELFEVLRVFVDREAVHSWRTPRKTEEASGTSWAAWDAVGTFTRIAYTACKGHALGDPRLHLHKRT